MSRSYLLDFQKFIAILLMVFFHFCFDLTYFKILNIHFQNDFFFWLLPRIIVTLFFSAVGASLYLTHHKAFQRKKFIKRQVILLTCAASISIITYFLFPKRWIYFGTLHSIFTLSLVAIPFVKFPKTALCGGLLFIIIEATGLSPSWFELKHKSMDYIEPLPWIAPVLIGIFLGHIGIYSIRMNIPFKSLVAFCGKHSLKIYLAHQVILFGLAYLIATIIYYFSK